MHRLALVVSLALALGWFEARAQSDDIPPIGPSNTDQTVPTSPYDHPGMTLEEQEQDSRNSLASQEVNRFLNQAFQEPEKTPLPGLTLMIAILILALGELWQHRGLIGSIAAAIGGVLSSTSGRRLWSKFWVWISRISGLWTLYQIVAHFAGWTTA